VREKYQYNYEIKLSVASKFEKNEKSNFINNKEFVE
jgi:hypothetical protein